jgi:hypothetical protein
VNKEEKKLYKRKYYKKNKEKILKRAKEHYVKNKKRHLLLSKIYRLKHKKYFKDYMKYYGEKYYKTHKKQIYERMKKYREKNIKLIIEKNKIYRLLNKDKIKKSSELYYLKNKEIILKKLVKYVRFRKRNDLNYKITSYLRSRIWAVLKENKKTNSTIKLIGCSIDFLKKHLESKFKPNMSWSNYGKWHIDHIRPCASFDLSKPSEQRKCFNYTNLQPLWAKENLQKGDKCE